MAKRSNDEKQVLKHLGERLRELRVSHEITQEELADLAGFSRSYYTEIETGKRNVSTLSLFRLAKGLGISLPELLHQLWKRGD